VSSGSPTKLPLFSVKLAEFCVDTTEYPVIKYFKWFSNILIELNPNSFDFSTNSLSRYSTTLPLVVIAFASEGIEEKIVICLVIVFSAKTKYCCLTLCIFVVHIYKLD